MLPIKAINKNTPTLSKKEYDSLQETNYLLSTTGNRKSLQKGISNKRGNKKLTPQEWNKLIKKY